MMPPYSNMVNPAAMSSTSWGLVIDITAQLVSGPSQKVCLEMFYAKSSLFMTGNCTFIPIVNDGLR